MIERNLKPKIVPKSTKWSIAPHGAPYTGRVLSFDLSLPERRAILSRVAEAIAQQVPGYYDNVTDHSHPLYRLRREVFRQSLNGFIQALRDNDVAGVDFTPQQELGRQECRYGRPLGDLLQIPWAASTQFWRLLVQDVAPERGFDSVHRISEMMMEWSARISMALSTGYHDELAAATGTLESKRRRLVELVLRQPPPTIAEVDAAAIEVGSWRVPRRLSVLVAMGQDGTMLRHALPAGTIATTIDETLVMLVPHPVVPGALGQIEAALDPHTIAALGPATEIAQARSSERRARLTLQLIRDGVIPADGIARCEDYTLELILLADREVAQDHVGRWLSPLLHTRPSTRKRLEATLGAWLRHHGSPAAAAQELGVHPHTISYRVTQLRDLLGTAIDDPERRFELEIALRLRRLLDRTPDGTSLASKGSNVADEAPPIRSRARLAR